jgi:tight adherence protein B
MTLVLALVVGAVVFLAARIVAARLRSARLRRRMAPHLATRVDAARREESPRTPADRGRRLLDRIENVLSSYRSWQTFSRRVERAGVRRRPVDVLAAAAVAAFLLFMLTASGGSALVMLFAFVSPFVLTWAGLGLLAQRRLRTFDEQLPDLLNALAASLRAGHGFLHALQAIAADAPDPAGAELKRVLAETRVGRPLEDALADLGRRVPSRDFVYVLTAIGVQRQVGGSLAGLFETVNDTVRQRQQFARKVRALTAAGRTSANMLIALPFGLALLLSLIDHRYLVPLFSSHVGQILVIAGSLSMLVGAVIVHRIVSFKG